jgi:hypothetical protein
VAPSADLFGTNTTLVRQRLLTRGLSLSQTDLDSIERAFKAFSAGGPEIHFWGSRPVDAAAARPSYRRLMTAEDATGEGRSFLSSEDGFRFVKDLQSRNLIVPVVGDVGGPSAKSEWAITSGGIATSSTRSTPERRRHLNNQQTRACRNLAALPAHCAWFIESDGVRSLTRS